MAIDTDKTPTVITNSFTKGMYKDSIPSLVPDGYYNEAWGAVLENEEQHSFGVGNEPSNELCAKIKEGFEPRGHYFIEERDWHVIFSSNGGSSEIGYIDNKNCTYNVVYEDDECTLDFGNKEWIPIVGKRQLPCVDKSKRQDSSMVLYWSVNEYYYRLNIDDLDRCEIDDCDDLLLFQCKCAPTPQAFTHKSGGHDLEAGAYQYVAQLEDEVGNKTNWFNVSNAVYIGSENNAAGDRSEQSISITVTDLPEEYAKINLGVISTIGGAVTAKVLTQLNYSKSGVSFLHRSKEQYLRELPIAEVLTKKTGHIRGKDLIQYDGRLFLFNVRGERNLDFQTEVNKIRARYKAGRVPMKYAHEFRGFPRNSVISLSIWYNYCDGRSTRAFHIPGKAKAVPGGNPNCTDCEDKNAINDAVRTGTFVSVEDSYDNTVTKDPDEYTPFTPTDQGLLDSDDFSTPNLDPIRDALEDSGEGDCDCDTINKLGKVAKAQIEIALFGGKISTNPIDIALGKIVDESSPADILAAYELKKKMCECDEEESSRSSGDGDDPLEPTYNSDDADKIAATLNLQSIVESGEGVTQADVITYLEALGIYDADGEGSSGFEVPESGSGSRDGGSRDDDEDPCMPETSNTGNPIEPPSHGNPNAGEDGGGPKPGERDGETENTGANDPLCDEDLSAGGDTPQEDGGIQSNNSSENKPKTKNTGVEAGGVSSSQQGKTLELEECEPTIIYEDEDCCVVKQIIPCIDAEGELGTYESCERYPETERCCGEGPVYGEELAGEFIRHHKLPSFDIEPHFISYQDGVPTIYNKDNHESSNSFARYLWIGLEEIPIPAPELLDAPLCDKNPFTIGYEVRDEANNSIIASGVFLETFLGDTLSGTRAFPRHGTNADVYVDRWVHNDQGGRDGDNFNPNPAYTFHSPETDFDKGIGLNPDYADLSLEIYGKGYRHELYSPGLAPDSPFVSRKHRKGAISSMNLNHYETKEKTPRCVKAISYAPADSVVSQEDGFTHSLVNLNRESSVYVELEGAGTRITDTSFSRRVSQHEEELGGRGLFGQLRRHIPNQYGSVVNATYHPLAQGTPESAKTGKLLIADGDSFINFYSKKRTSYVSDQVSEDISPAFEFGGGFTTNFLLGNLLKAFFNTIGAEECGTIPQPGNGERDPRSDDDANGSGTDDRFFPQTQTQLLSFPVESSINLGFRGSGDTPSTSTYRDLNGQNLVSVFDGGDGAYDDSWLNRYYATLTENSKWKMLIRVIANAIFTYGVGIWLIVQGYKVLSADWGTAIFGFANSILIVFASVLAVFIMLLGAFWIIGWVNTDLDNRFIDNLLGIQDCFPDKKAKSPAGTRYSMRDNRVRGLEDNHYAYNRDFSEVNKIQVAIGLPDPYLSCECQTNTTYRIPYSRKQDPTSFIDNYRNFDAISYVEIPPDTGPFKKMFKRNNRLYLHTSGMLWNLRAGQSQMQTGDDDTVFLGRSDVINVPIEMYGGPHEGYAGILDPNAAINTVWGYIWIDREARKIFIFNGSNVEELGTMTMRNWLRENLFFEALKENPDLEGVDERVEGSVWYTLGVDHRHDRLLITKRDFNGSGDCSWTLSYSFMTKNFVAYHWYKPDFYMWDRHDMLSVKDAGAWKHNVNGDFQRFYGEYYPFKIEFSSNNKQNKNAFDTFEWQNTTIDLEAHKWAGGRYITNRLDRFTEVSMWNSYQATGKTPFVYLPEETDGVEDPLRDSEENFHEIILDYLKRRWRYNNAFDNLVEKDQAILLPERCKPSEVNEGLINKDWEEDPGVETEGLGNKKFLDNHLTTQYTHNNPGDSGVKLLLKVVQTEVDTETI